MIRLKLITRPPQMENVFIRDYNPNLAPAPGGGPAGTTSTVPPINNANQPIPAPTTTEPDHAPLRIRSDTGEEAKRDGVDMGIQLGTRVTPAEPVKTSSIAA